MMSTLQTIGTLELSSKYRYGLTSRGAPLFLFRPIDEALPDFIVGSSHRDTSRDQLALVEIPAVSDPTQTTNTKPRGTLIRLLGPVGDLAAEHAALLLHYCPARHKPSDSIPLPTEDTDAPERLPIDAAHGWTVLHVDPPGCRDIDDAIAFHPATNRCAILIADATAAVPAGSPLDTTARAIGATFYTPAGQVVRPMLPPTISEGSASLLPGQPGRRAVALLIRTDTLHQPTPDSEDRFVLAQTTVEHSLTYESFATAPIIRTLGLETQEPHAWIETLMIRYNAAAGQRLQSAGVGLLRTQAAADAEAVAHWRTISPELAWMANEAATYAAVSPTEEQPHAGLGLVAYAHASSPLRRYADLVNQRILKALLSGSALPPPLDPNLPAALNDRQRANRRWARDALFLDAVQPGRVMEMPIVWISADRVWVPVWRRLLRLRHTVAEPPVPGTHDTIQVFCDPRQRNWKQRVRTAPSPAPAPAPATSGAAHV